MEKMSQAKNSSKDIKIPAFIVEEIISKAHTEIFCFMVKIMN